MSSKIVIMLSTESLFLSICLDLYDSGNHLTHYCKGLFVLIQKLKLLNLFSFFMKY